MNITSSIRRMVLMNRGMLLHSLYKLQKHKLHTDIHMRCCIKEWVYFFLGSWGMNRSAGQTNRVNLRGSRDLFVPRYDSYPMNPEKRQSFLIFTMFPTRTLSKILQEKLFIQNSHSNGHFASFDVLITAHVIRPNRRTFCWLCLSGIQLKNFSRVQRRKYDTIVNICLWIQKKKQYLSRRYAMGYIASIVKLL